MQPRILVLGGTGLLGEPVARRLRADGFRVRIVTRDLEAACCAFDPSFEPVEADVRDREALEAAFGGCQGVHVSVAGPLERHAAVTRNPKLRFASELMAYFDGVQELGDRTGADRLLGKPTTTMDEWLRDRREEGPVGV